MKSAVLVLSCEFLADFVLEEAAGIATRSAVAKDGEGKQMAVGGSGIACETGCVGVSARLGMNISPCRTFCHSFHDGTTFPSHG